MSLVRVYSIILIRKKKILFKTMHPYYATYVPSELFDGLRKKFRDVAIDVGRSLAMSPDVSGDTYRSTNVT